ncbi:phage protein Gp36 family protein [Sphingomonas hengshuiensis]|uniref:DUF1320 domain-containing protein n=1 Tax=Sphingomonas hengshuiensis TaxID=1609977 RepID=A0A7U4JAA5_9SPHN|nr:phage protein Gp36 family protein [Sphingomonas hengshuiensis]AJP73165.1 hypothetical protein TS85_17260 [Sphingomonas hengshuiensis]
MYATADDIRARYGEDVLVQLAGADAWGPVAIAAVNLKLADASVLADGYIAKYYAPAPGAVLPPLLVQLVCKIAYCEMHRVPTEEASRQRAEAMKVLGDISRGLVKIDEGRGDLPARDGAVLVEDPGRTFSRDRLGGF